MDTIGRRPQFLNQFPKHWEHQKALMLDVLNGNPHAIASLIAQGEHLTSLLLISAQKGHIVSVEVLIKKAGVPVNSVNDKGQNALMFAAANGRTEVITYLLTQPNIAAGIIDKDKYQKTAIDYAWQSRHPHITYLLVSHLHENQILMIDLPFHTKGNIAEYFREYDKFSNTVFQAVVKLLCDPEWPNLKSEILNYQSYFILKLKKPEWCSDALFAKVIKNTITQAEKTLQMLVQNTTIKSCPYHSDKDALTTLCNPVLMMAREKEIKSIKEKKDKEDIEKLNQKLSELNLPEVSRVDTNKKPKSIGPWRTSRV